MLYRMNNSSKEVYDTEKRIGPFSISGKEAEVIFRL